jgi:hypothetical protein
MGGRFLLAPRRLQSMGVNRMATVHDFIEDWIEMRSKLQRQLKIFESGELSAGTAVFGSTMESTIIRIKKWIDELNALLKEYAHSDRP